MPSPLHSAKSILRVRAMGGASAELLIYGDIGESWAGSSVSAKEVVDTLNALSGVTEINVRINSAGGSVTDGLAIYNALRRHPARKLVTIDGVAASIASLIAMAGDVVAMPRTSLLMIHAPWSTTTGNADELRRFADVLDGWSSTMAEAYSAKSNQPVASVLALLGDGADHWYTGDEAVAAGFADEIAGMEHAGNTAPGVDPAEYAQGFSRFISRAPARIAASLRDLAEGATAMPDAAQKDMILAAERDRRSMIRAMAGANFDDPKYRDFVTHSMDNSAVTPEAFGHDLLARMAAGREPIGGGFHPEHAAGGRACGDFVNAAGDALVIRAGITVAKPHAGSRDFMTMDVAELARACLSRAGKSNREFDRVGAIRAALSTSDFPALLGNALGKSLRTGYEAEPQSHALWARFVQVEDFKPQIRALLSSAPELLHVPEGSEYPHGAIGDDSAVYAVAKFGRIIRLTWEALINDDLGAFVRVPQAMGQAARRKEADLVYGLFAANGGAGPTMQDTKTLFHADHANLATGTASLDAAGLSYARTLLRKQTAKGGGLLNLQPRYLIVPAELETAAETLLATSQRAAVQGSSGNVLPSWIGGLIPVVEPRLAANAFYIAAAPEQVDTLEVAGLASDRAAPVIEEHNEFVRDSQGWKVRHVVAAAFTDWRGIVKVPVA